MTFTRWLNSSRIFLFFLIIFSSRASAQLVNIERQRLNADSNGVFGDADLSFRVFKVNEPLYNFTQNAQVVYRKDKNQYFLIENLNVVKSPGTNFANSGFMHLRYQRPAGKPLLGEAFYQVQYNQLLKIRFRQLAGVGARWEVFSKDTVNKGFLGAMLMNEFEIIQDQSKNNFDLRWSFYAALRLKLFKNIEVNSTTYYQPLMGMASDYRVSTENVILFSVRRNIQFKFEINFFHDSNPPAGVVKDTYWVSNGIRYKF